MKQELNRRDFLKLAGAAMGSLAFRPLSRVFGHYDSGNLVRVASHSVSVYMEPNDKSQIICQRYRDEILHVYYEVQSDSGPAYNPLWYRVWRGYVHSGRVVRVQNRLNIPLTSIPEGGQLGEITVPYTQALRNRGNGNWDENIYRLYNESMHWITGIEEGPDGEPWYQLHDELLEIKYFVPAAHVRPVLAAEFEPISPDVPAHKKHIEVSIAGQTLTAFEGEKEVLHTTISSGVPSRTTPLNGIPTATPYGHFKVYSKMPSKHMGDGNITGDIEAYEIPGVPWTTFFAPGGVAFHGTYWHNSYGVQMSHGCINMRTSEANWIFRWTTPVSKPSDWEKRGGGTLVIVS
jgi:hypothetical protein